MGGRGSNSKIQTAAPATRSHVNPQQQVPVSQQAPTAQNTPVTAAAITALSQMTDAQLAQLVRQSKSIDMPNVLKDVADQTQAFVFAAGLNEMPTVLDDADFAQFMQDNNISNSQILSRSVNPITYTNANGSSITMKASDVIDMLKYSRLNYIGGKVGGQAYGAGTYFDQTGGSSTGYGKATAIAVLNPKTAKVITDSQLSTKARAFAQSHPQFAKAAGAYDTSFHNNNMSIYALAMGYNVIKESTGGYHNVIDRSALVYRKSNG